MSWNREERSMLTSEMMPRGASVHWHSCWELCQCNTHTHTDYDHGHFPDSTGTSGGVSDKCGPQKTKQNLESRANNTHISRLELTGIEAWMRVSAFHGREEFD